MLDLALGGVHAEMGEIPFGWFDAPMAVAATAPVTSSVTMPREVVASETLRPVTLPVQREAIVAVPAARPSPAAEIAGEVWTEGEADGVLLVTQTPPDARCAALANAMLLAVGVKDMAVAWVGYSGKVDAKAMLEAMRRYAPKQVLVLGQAPLGVLLGRNLGVEGWHASGNKDIAGWEGAPVGVTYPLELLLKQPLFKRLAWQHLLAWGEDNSLVLNSISQGE